MRRAGMISGVLFVVVTCLGMDTYPGIRLRRQAHLAVSEDRNVAEAAIAQLRAAGPRGLAAMLEAHGLDGQQPIERDALRQEVRSAIDAVAGQHNAYTSRLFWHTDLEAAKAMSMATHRPILSLRLLGKLTDELSCANSRFFRSTLYANEEISHTLRENFVLHWQSVRPAVKVTVDFGDGRKLETTVTGNSLHFLLDANGRPLDALPGLYGPKAFARWLASGQMLHREMSSAAPNAWQTQLTEAHRNRLTLLNATWQNCHNELALPDEPSALGDADWSKVALQHAGDAELDAASKALIRAQNPDAVRAGRLARSKAFVEDPLARMFRNLQQTIAIDTVRNEFTLHRKIHEWFVAGQVADDVTALNERIYAELFLTPSSDPWLGLMPRGAYAGLENGGIDSGAVE